MLDIFNFDSVELEAKFTTELGLEAYRAKQVRPWLYKKRVSLFEEMTNIAKPTRDLLTSRFRIYRPVVIRHLSSSDGSQKFLFELTDGSRVESVLIKQDNRNTLCVSSQVGCGMGCVFCCTATMGFRRNLETYEIIAQIIEVKDRIASCDPGCDFSNIVFMGMGEPLHNYDNVVRAVRILNDELGLSYSSRKITVSTSGLVSEINRFGQEGVGANIAISLNATTDEVRSKIMPINRKWSIDSLLSTLRHFPTRRNRCITIEYVMLRGVNDTAADLQRLPKLLHGIDAKLNLIPYNSVTSLSYESPAVNIVMEWQRSLCSAGLNTRIRWSKGGDIMAACGQLAVPLKTANS